MTYFLENVYVKINSQRYPESIKKKKKKKKKRLQPILFKIVDVPFEKFDLQLMVNTYPSIDKLLLITTLMLSKYIWPKLC